MEEQYKKKGQTGSVGAIIALITGVGVAVLVLIFVGALGGQTYNLVETDIDGISGSVTNETFTATNNVAVSLANNVIDSSTMGITNTTGGTIGLSNFSINYNLGKVTLTNAAYDGNSLLASYTYGDSGVETAVKGGIVSGFEALEQTGNYLPIIVLAVVISLVLALVLGMGYTGGTQGGSVL